MPRPKRYFPASKDLNHDPEVRELRRLFGAEMVLAWFELLALTEATDGALKGAREDIARMLAPVLSNPRHSRVNVATLTSEALHGLSWMESHGWLEFTTSGLRICNYWKYHAEKADKRRTRGRPVMPSDRPTSFTKVKGIHVRPSGADSETGRPELKPVGQVLAEKGIGVVKTGPTEPVPGPSVGPLESPYKTRPGALEDYNTNDRRRLLAEQARQLAAAAGNPTAPEDELVSPPKPPDDPPPANGYYDPSDPYAELRGLTPAEFDVKAKVYVDRGVALGLDKGIMTRGVEQIRVEIYGSEEE